MINQTRTFTLRTAFSLLALVALFGCNNTSTPAGPALTPAEGGMVCYVGGSSWQSTSVPGYTNGAGAIWTSSSSRLVITGIRVGSSTDSTAILFTTTSLATGDYTLSLATGTSGSSASYVNGKNSSNVYATLINAGKLNLSKVDTINHVISGTFNFTATNQSLSSVSITGGSFLDVPLVKN